MAPEQVPMRFKPWGKSGVWRSGRVSPQVEAMYGSEFRGQVMILVVSGFKYKRQQYWDESLTADLKEQRCSPEL